MQISAIDYDNHLGQISIGKIYEGKVKKGDKVVLADNPYKLFTIEKIFVSEGLGKKEEEMVGSGEIVRLIGVTDFKIGETICDPNEPKVLPQIAIGEPTIHISLGANTSPFAGKEGKFTTSDQLETRIMKELEKNLSLRVVKADDGKFRISGRGEAIIRAEKRYSIAFLVFLLKSFFIIFLIKKT